MDDLQSLLSTWGGAVAVVPLALLLNLGLRGKLPRAVAPALVAAAVAAGYLLLGEHDPVAQAAPLIVGALMVLAMRGQDQMWPVLLSLALAGPAAWLMMYGEVPAQAVAPASMAASAPRPALVAASRPARSASDADMASGGRLGLVLDGTMARRGEAGTEETDKPAPAAPAAGGSLGRQGMPSGGASRPMAPPPPPQPPAQPVLPPMNNAPVTIPVVPSEPATATYVPPVTSGQVQNSTAGQHPGFAAECRWVSPTVWACPQAASR